MQATDETKGEPDSATRGEQAALCDAAQPAPAELRAIRAMTWPDVTPAAVTGSAPEIRLVAPSSLFIEERYQRALGEKSITLIRKIIREFDWCAFKPPICADIPGVGLVVIDGQHTAIAAASHGGIVAIPVVIAEAGTLAERATAFLRHNRDRVAMTSQQMHHSAVAAGDEVAVAMEEVARRSETKILRYPPPYGKFAVGDTMAIGSLRRITETKGVVFTTRVMRLLKEAKRAPIKASELQAIAALLSDPDWRDAIDPDRLGIVLRSKTADEWQLVAETTVRKGRAMPMWRALAIVLFTACPKKRGAA